MSDDQPVYRRFMERTQTLVSHWEGIVIVLMFSILLGFTLGFFTSVYLPFTNVYPPQSATGFVVHGNISASGQQNNYTLACSGDTTLQRWGTFRCNYTFATSSHLTALRNDGTPLLSVTWWPFTGKNVTDTIMQIRTADRTGNFSFHAPKRAERYMIRVKALQPARTTHSIRYRIPDGETTTFRIFSDRQELSILYRLLILTFNIIVLTSVWFSAGEVAVELLERIDEKEAARSDQGY